jgi:hypothetical protein
MPHCSVVMGEIEKVMASKQPACTFCILQDKECLRHAPIKKLKDLVMKYHENQEGNYSAEMTAQMKDCEFCKSSFQDVCCGCRFNWNSQTVQLFHADRQGLQAQISKLGHNAENSNPCEQGPSRIGAEYLAEAGTDGLENVSRWSLCSSLDTIQSFHDYAVDNLDEFIPDWSSEHFSEDPAHSLYWRELEAIELEALQDSFWPVPWETLLPDLDSISTDSMFNMDNDDGRDTPPPIEEHIDDATSARASEGRRTDDIELTLAQMDGQVASHADAQNDRANEEEASLNVERP